MTSELRVIYIAPRLGAGGVGDYAEDIVAALRTNGISVTRLGFGGALDASAVDLIRAFRAVRATRASSTGRDHVVVHHELSSGSLESFWTLLAHGPPTTVMIHDVPHAVWVPLRTRGIARRRWLNHGLHYPFRRLWWLVEDRMVRKASAFTLTVAGAAALGARNIPAEPLFHYIPDRQPILAPRDRPRGVGLFGYYSPGNGKGFDHIASLRSMLSADVSLHVAGRGTSNLPAADGVRIWGEVEGETEAAFFTSVRCLVLPYEAGSRYGEVISASGTAARAFAYDTPVVASPVRGFERDAAAAVVLSADLSVASLVAAAEALVDDVLRLDIAARRIRDLRVERSAAALAEILATRWREMVGL